MLAGVVKEFDLSLRFLATGRFEYFALAVNLSPSFD
jgi:hypothetical protein